MLITLGYVRGHGTPRRLRDVDVRTLARPLPACFAVPAGTAARVRDVVQRRGGQYDVLRDARPGHGAIVGRADRARLPVYPHAAQNGYAWAPPRRGRRPAPRVPGRDRAPRAAGARAVDSAAPVVQPRRPRRPGPLPAPSPARAPVLRRGTAPRVLHGSAIGTRARAGAK